MSRSSQPLNFEYIILGYIFGQPMHGYDLYRLLNTDPAMAEIWHVKQAMLYALLDKLEEMGMLTSEMIHQDTYPSRKQFSITPQGLAAFTEWKATPVEHPREIRQEFMARLYFAFRSSRGEARHLLLQQRQVCYRWLEIYLEHTAEADEDEFTHMLIDYKQSQITSILEWINYCLGSIPNDSQ